MTRDEILQRYRHLRLISIGHHSGALKFLSRQAVLEHAKRLGLATGGMLVAESEAEMTLVFDLALYTAKERRSRALDRYARATKLPPGSDAARVLEAMRQARFSVWRINRRHETAGLIITDVLREAEVWLVMSSWRRAHRRTCPLPGGSASPTASRWAVVSSCRSIVR